MISLIRDGFQFVRQNDLPTVWSEFSKRDTHPLLQFVKYGLCGGLALITQLIVFYGLAYTVFPAIEGMIVEGQLISNDLRAKNATICNSFGFFFANLVAYFTNVLWVFQSGRHNRAVEFGLFTVVALIGFVAGLAGGPLLIKVFGISTHIAQLLFVVTSVIVNFLCRKFLIFKH